MVNGAKCLEHCEWLGKVTEWLWKVQKLQLLEVGCQSSIELKTFEGYASNDSTPIETCYVDSDNVTCYSAGINLSRNYAYYPESFIIDDNFCAWNKYTKIRSGDSLL